MKGRTHRIAALAAIAALLVATSTAFGYQSQVEGTANVSARGTVTCAAPFTLIATFVDASGKPLGGQSVAWSFKASPSNADRINQTPSVTNSKGVATTTVTLGLVSGTRKIGATSGSVSAAAVLNPSCGGTGGVLPNTSTLPGETPGSTPFAWTLLLVAFTVAAGGWLTLRRLASARG